MTEICSRAAARRLIVFSRLPQLGQVKTRLAREVGDQSALQIHMQLLNATLDLVAQHVPHVPRELRYAGELNGPHNGPHNGLNDGPESEAASLLNRLRLADWMLTPQCGADLGARMHDALAQALRAGQTPVLIGSDCPVLSADDLAQAFIALQTADVVFAPAQDGGYALVGLRREAPELFAQVDWGTEQVMSQTLAHAQALGLEVRLLRTVWDVDTPADLRRWRALAPGRSGR
jgi:rSAM/selenodomain-associated transferase 1